MEIILDIRDSTDPSDQLVEQIKAAVLSDAIGPGEPLPSVRQLANDLGLEEETVARAYRKLERGSVIRALVR